MNVLVTGGTGYIGSHTVVELLAKNHQVTVVDNLCNSDQSVVERIEKIAKSPVVFKNIDVLKTDALASIMGNSSFDSVIHFAALKAIGASTQKPLEYYKNNIGGLISVIEAAQSAGINKLIFSSSATVYGDPDFVPITEDHPLKTTTNPYGETKQMAERIIQDICKATTLQAVILRYFNPIGAHISGLIGENPQGAPNNLVPYLVQAAAGVRDKLTVFGNDYPTPDGSGVRDYIHVVDLAKAHVAALSHLDNQSEPTSVFNIGTGKGASVLELINTFERVNGVKVPYQIGPRRPGDIASCYADAAKANEILGWKAEHSLEQSLVDAWRWQQTLLK